MEDKSRKVLSILILERVLSSISTAFKSGMHDVFYPARVLSELDLLVYSEGI